VQTRYDFSLETMVNEKNIATLLPLMWFDHFDFVLSANHSGGSNVLWNEGNIYVSILTKERRVVHMRKND